jgi:hypothetical protein
VLEVLQALAVRPAPLEVLQEMPPALPLATPTRGSFSTAPFLSLSNAKATATPPPTAVRSLLRLSQSFVH